ncbi:hypothetical protein IFM89_022379 [Coptis chinensis]|uniref:RNA polymerase Rpb4/RPC9 core domain-containing protein n=1 Tax=Coptis chinensis TaxID=261450 RepID=A0A835IXU8_9MAGN|nr:hypothetical protein IFM89_022379 [Coptis chinensis]
MAEKGGKGFLTKKSSLSSSKGGKGSSTLLPKKKVHFTSSSSSGSDSDDSLPPSSTKDYGKGGKPKPINDKAGTPNPPKIPIFDIENDLPKNTKCLMDCEAEAILSKIQEQMVILSDDPMIKLPVSFHKGLQYAKSGCGYSNVESARRVLETLKANNKVSESEICLIGNICPDGVDELFALMPSLKGNKGKNERAVKDVVGLLAKMKEV